MAVSDSYLGFVYERRYHLISVMSSMPSLSWKCAVAVAMGIVFDAVYFWQFLPYAIRDTHGPILPLWTLPCFTFTVALVLTFARTRHRFWIPSAILGFLTAHICLIVADCWHDPTNHNLFPFELAIICIVTAPAFIATGLNTALRRSVEAN
jgi:hypothetical protein